MAGVASDFLATTVPEPHFQLRGGSHHARTGLLRAWGGPVRAASMRQLCRSDLRRKSSLEQLRPPPTVVGATQAQGRATRAGNRLTGQHSLEWERISAEFFGSGKSDASRLRVARQISRFT